MTDSEAKEGARLFAQKWLNRGREDEDDRSYWIDIFQKILDVDDATDKIEFQKKVLVNGNTKRIDAYIPETKVIIEQKSLGKALDKKIHNSGDVELTPYEQAKRYNDNLPYDEKARYIVTSNFAEIWIYDMNLRDPESDVQKINIQRLQNEYYRLGFLCKVKSSKITKEMEVSIQAGDIVGLLYDELYKNYAEKNEEVLKSLNKLCVRLVFCMYADDAGVLGKKDMFHDYLIGVEPKKIRRALKDLFRILDTPEDERDPDEDEELLEFPYVNGGLFSDEDIAIPQFTEELKELLLQKASNDFDWSEISPTIFGAIFESTLNPATRRSGGMHYTSIENIHRVIDPLFLDDLKAEFEECKNKQNVGGARTKALQKFQDKIASLKFLDPAAGSGNFLTESYTSLRKLENQILKELKQDVFSGQMVLNFINEKDMFDIKVSIQQFYGIEINDFAVTVAKTALWIAEAQMMKETLSFADVNAHFLPLKSYVNITEGNSLRIDWDDVIPSSECNFIMGNPPFVGARIMSKEQKEDLVYVFGKDWKNSGNLDYVSCWYKKAFDYMAGTKVKTALVSTNSITQGESVADLWQVLFNKGVHIDFAYRTFRWDSEAKIKAHVHCVIVGFSVFKDNKKKKIYEITRYKDGTESISIQETNNINGYLISADNIAIENRNKPIHDVPEMGIGNKPIDDGNYLFTEEEMLDFVKLEPNSKDYFKKWYGAQEFIKQKPRYCLWLGDCTPAQLRSLPNCLKRVEAVKEFRLSSKSAGTVKLASKPTRFHVENMPKENYVVIPRVSSERRDYIPMGFMNPDSLCSDAILIIPKCTLYHFGVLTSNVHMAWMSAVCGRLKSDYRYSAGIVYNNFPWPEPTDEQRKKIEHTAQKILNVRAQFPDSSLADLYDPSAAPYELTKAHEDNDRAVMQAYGFSIRNMSKSDCVAALLKLYQEQTN